MNMILLSSKQSDDAHYYETISEVSKSTNCKFQTANLSTTKRFLMNVVTDLQELLRKRYDCFWRT